MGSRSPLWKANVEGRFVSAEAGQLFTLEDVLAAEARWDEASIDGRLHIGVDVAGEGHEGDETAFATRRGRKVLELTATRALSPDGILDHVLGLLRKYRAVRAYDGVAWELHQEGQLPIVTVDRDGSQGARVYQAINAYRAAKEGEGAPEFKLIGFRGGEVPNGRAGDTYRLTRDALYGGLVEAFKDGLGIPPDVKLEAELCAVRWVENTRGKQVLCSKYELRDRLARSPDRADALALCTWGEARDLMAHVVSPPPRQERPAGGRPGVTAMGALTSRGGPMDPYSVLGASMNGGTSGRSGRDR